MKVQNSLGLVFSFSDSGSLQSIDADPIRISMTASSVFARAGANLYLRKRGSELTYTPLLGPHARVRASEAGFEATGSWQGLDYACALQPASAQLAWQWRVRVTSRLEHPVELDLLYVQDVGLKTKSSGLTNEYYVSQYLERRVLEDARHGSVICCRQNMAEAGGHPWLLLASVNGAVAASTDGSQFYGSTFRATGEPEALRADRLQGELSGEASVVALQERPFVLDAAQSHTSTFVASYSPDHAQASSEADLERLPELVGAFSEAAASGVEAASESVRFQSARLLPVEDLTQAELEEHFGSAWRHVERDDGLLSFFTDGPRHVVLRAKETRVDRPHGHIMQANAGLVPDESVMSTTAFACGVFHSHLTQGNTNFNTLLSVCTQPAASSLEGQRILLQREDGEYLLGVPSAFAMELNACRWLYKFGSSLLEVRSWTSPRAPLVHLQLKVLRGAPVRFSLTHQFDSLNGWTLQAGAANELIATPRADSMLAGEFPNAQFRLLVDGPSRSYETERTFVLEVPAVSTFRMSFVGEVTGPAQARPQNADSDRVEAESAWRDLSRNLVLGGPAEISAIDTTLPWFGANALIHFLTPYGLEQFSGAAWGTRDVSQGPIDLLLCQEKFEEAKQVLRILFSRQNQDGGWPQWWMFDSYRDIRADSAHGDVVYWTILALCSYLKTSGDFAFLDEALPYFSGEEASPVSEHVDRILELVVDSFVPNTALVQFGGGDWNDSLQPVSDELTRRLISSWTVQMSYQAICDYREVWERAGNAAKASELQALATRIHADFNRHLVKDDVVAGYGLVRGEEIDVLLHPSDETTGVHYSLLPMNRGVISGAFSKPQAEAHLQLIERHLKGPDGARLMDRPLRYQGGPQTIFQRAESSTYFGREIGLMYVHEHLRYAESLSRMGRAEPFLRALRQAIPVDYQELVPQGDLRQANCYYSSSDVLFRSRYEADERYAEVIAGKLPLRGGWRVYSSGPGIYIAIVVTRLLGLRTEYGDQILDPVLAPSLNGLTAALKLHGRAVTFHYRVQGPGFGPQSLTINGKATPFEREANPYREGGAVLKLARFLALLDANENTVELVV
ncbi:MAG TPA: amylo-alpha-1,6-glucosidase [Polyangiales bacterium]|nr:amylo-alpha-1,6-glucosidase [Polyangiales bacterium]